MESGQQSSGGGSNGKKPWAAYNIIEKGEKTFWSRVGSAFHNHDGSINIWLEAFPLQGKIHIRPLAEDRDGQRHKGALATAAEVVEAAEA
jgi:hypothetical protein